MAFGRVVNFCLRGHAGQLEGRQTGLRAPLWLQIFTQVARLPARLLVDAMEFIDRVAFFGLCDFY